MQDSWNTGQVEYMKGGMQDRWDTIMQDKWNTGEVICRTGEIQDRWDTGQVGCRKFNMQDR